MTTKKEITEFVTKRMDEDGVDYRDREHATGMCFEVSNEIAYEFGGKTIFAFHDNDPEGRFMNLGQHSDHFATLHYGKVLDYTLRQFKEDTAWPFYGTVQEWVDILSDTWETKVTPTILADIADYDLYV